MFTSSLVWQCYVLAVWISAYFSVLQVFMLQLNAWHYSAESSVAHNSHGSIGNPKPNLRKSKTSCWKKNYCYSEPLSDHMYTDWFCTDAKTCWLILQMGITIAYTMEDLFIHLTVQYCSQICSRAQKCPCALVLSLRFTYSCLVLRSCEWVFKWFPLSDGS